MKYSVTRTLVYFLIFTAIASAIAFKLVVASYDTTYEIYATALQED